MKSEHDGDASSVVSHASSGAPASNSSDPFSASAALAAGDPTPAALVAKDLTSADLATGGPTPAALAAGGPTSGYPTSAGGSSSMRLTFSADKNRYNKFHYKIKLVPTEMRTQWQLIRSQEATCPDSFDAFVNDVIAYEVNERTSKKRVIKDVMENTSTGEWMPWHEAVGKEGYDVLLSMVTTGASLPSSLASEGSESMTPASTSPSFSVPICRSVESTRR